jgi:hypothetical protein
MVQSFSRRYPRLLAVLAALGAFVLLRSPSPEEARFAAVVACWQSHFPTLPPEPDHMCDGPTGNRIHVFVPVEVENLCRKPYSLGLLEEKLARGTAAERFVAYDLLLLRKPLLFTSYGRVGYGGCEQVECTVYVVDNDPHGIRVLRPRKSILPPLASGDGSPNNKVE